MEISTLFLLWPISRSSGRYRKIKGMLGYNLKDSLMQHSKYLSSVKSCVVQGRSASSKTAFNSSTISCFTSIVGLAFLKSLQFEKWFHKKSLNDFFYLMLGMSSNSVKKPSKSQSCCIMSLFEWFNFKSKFVVSVYRA